MYSFPVKIRRGSCLQVGFPYRLSASEFRTSWSREISYAKFYEHSRFAFEPFGQEFLASRFMVFLFSLFYNAPQVI